MATKVPEGGFWNRDGLTAWLDSLPEDKRAPFARAIAFRAAMRVLPFTIFEKVSPYPKKAIPFEIVLSVFRANSVAWMAVKYPSREIISGARSSVAALEAAVYSQSSGNVYAAAAASVSAARSASVPSIDDAINYSGLSCTSAAEAARAAISARAGGDLWSAVSIDAERLSAANYGSFIHTAVWPSDSPMWAQEAQTQMHVSLMSVKDQYGGDAGSGMWNVWLEWYDARVAGKTPWRLRASMAENLEMRIALGDNRDDFWARKPEAINAEIMGWVENARNEIEEIGEPQPTTRGLNLTFRDNFFKGDTEKLESEEFIRETTVSQTPGAIQFEGGDDEPISVRHRASVEEWDTGLKAARRHSELLRLVEALLRRCHERMQTTDSVRELLEDIRLFRDALGATVHDFDPDIAIPRGDGLRQTLSAYKNDDNFSRLPPISDDILLALGKAIPAYNQFISLDDHLAKRDEALLGPDARKRMVGPKEGQPRIEAAVEGGAAKQEVREFLEVEALPAPDQPDPENRASRRYSEGNKNFARRAIEKAWEYGLNVAKSKPVLITTVSGGAGYRAATWVWDNKDWLLSVFAENPTMLKIIKGLLELLAKLPLG